MGILGAGASTGSLGHTVDVTYDLTDPASGAVRVEVTWHDLDRRELAFRMMGRAEEVAVEDVRFATPAGPLEATRDGATWTPVEPIPDGPITGTWTARPGGMGRHGHQGWIGPDWAAFDGRVLLQPTSRRSVRTARFKVRAPDGWTVVHPWTERDGWLVEHDAGHLKSMLTATCIAVGDFDVRALKVGDTEVRVGSPRSWDASWRDTLAQKTFAEFTWFHEELGYDRRHPFTVAWLPRPADGEQVFGGASVNGACYEHPVESSRNWLLLGHRIGHPMNRYTPSGMSLRDERDHWFEEGWVSYIEVIAAQGSGAVPDQSHWNQIYRRYVSHVALHPEEDVPLAAEPRHPAASEYLHYTKGPLVVRALDDLVRRRSGTTLEAFMREVWAEHGFHQRPLALREELEAFTGDRYDDFWAAFVDQVGALYPTWPEAEVESVSSRREAPPAGWVGDRPIHPELLFWLAWSGRFERYADIEAFLIDAAHGAGRREARGEALLPPAVEGFRYTLPPVSQAAMLYTERDWRVDLLPVRSGCFGGAEPARPSVRWSDSADGQTFARLLELEAVYESQVGRSVQAVAFATGRTNRLGVGPHDRVTVLTRWVAPPPRAGVEIHVDGAQVAARQHTVGPAETVTRITFDADQRPSDASILLVRTGPDALPKADRPLWQRMAPFTRQAARKPEEPDEDPAPTPDPEDVPAGE